MPYEIVKVPKGYFVVTKPTGKKHSIKPFQSKKAARQQQKALYAAESRSTKSFFK